MSDSPEVSHQIGAHQGGTAWLKRLEQEDRQVASTVEKVVRDLQDLATAAEEQAVGRLLAATARVDGEETQSGILQALLDEGGSFASRIAFFLTRPGEVRGWSARGFENSETAIEGRQFEYEDGSVWARMASTNGAVALDTQQCREVCQSLEAVPGDQGVLIPFVLRGQLGGVLYADRLDGEGHLGTASLQLLTHSAAQSIETAAIRGGGSSPTLNISGGERSPVSLWRPQDETPETALDKGSAHAAIAAGAAVAVTGVAAALASSDNEEESPDEPAKAPDEPAKDEAVSEPAPGLEASPLEASPLEAPTEASTMETLEEQPEEEVTTAVETIQERDSTQDEEIDSTKDKVAFEMVSTAAADEVELLEPEGLIEEDLEAAAADIEDELIPEPELEDTSELWASDDESTLVDVSPTEEVVEPAAAEISSADLPAAVSLDPTVGQETVRLDIAALQGQIPTDESMAAGAVSAEVPEPEVEAPSVPEWDVESVADPGVTPASYELEPEEPSYELEPDSEAVTTPMAKPDFGTATDDFSEDPTIMTSREDLGVSPPSSEPAPMAGGYVPPAPAEATPPPSTGFATPPPKPEATGTTQVVPPTDIQGPGSAFSGSSSGIPDGEEALHEEARRLARLLVSEIKLYNEEIIDEGRRAGNIYDRLKDDIDRSRQMYEERIDPRLSESGNDYFRQELVQRLAGGDERLLGY